VPDQKPPRLAGDERETLHALLQYQRESLVRKVADVDDAAARSAIVGSGTSLLWLVKHMARAECLWILSRFGGEDLELVDDAVRPDDSIASAVAEYRRTWLRVDEVVGRASSLDESCQHAADGGPVNLRWVLMHLLEETARHAGHADIIRELIDGRIGR
jgi:uncharacterized damage-inducible protein DinB